MKEKLSLTKEMPLKIFAVLVRPGSNVLSLQEECVYAVAYSQDEAIEKVNRMVREKSQDPFTFKCFRGEAISWFLDRATIPEVVTATSPPIISSDAAAAVALEEWLQRTSDVTKTERNVIGRFIAKQREQFTQSS